MTETPASEDAPKHSATAPDKSSETPWLSGSFVGLCIAIFIGLNLSDSPNDWETMAVFGAVPTTMVWDGAWWSLITSAFVHKAIWHLVFNIYWLWLLGSLLEVAIGRVRYVVFVLVAAFVSSGCQLALGAGTGIGFSGVLYAMFGFMWLTRERYPSFQRILTGQTIYMMLVWFVVCIIATYTGALSVGNGAHGGGLAFGVCVAAAFVHSRWRIPAIGGLAALLALVLAGLLWCPWSSTWLSHEAFKAHTAQNYEVALLRYTQVIERDPADAWAYWNRSIVQAALGHTELSASDLKKATELDPAISSR